MSTKIREIQFRMTDLIDKRETVGLTDLEHSEYWELNAELRLLTQER